MRGMMRWMGLVLVMLVLAVGTVGAEDKQSKVPPKEVKMREIDALRLKNAMLTRDQVVQSIQIRVQPIVANAEQDVQKAVQKAAEAVGVNVEQYEMDLTREVFVLKGSATTTTTVPAVTTTTVPTTSEAPVN